MAKVFKNKIKAAGESSPLAGGPVRAEYLILLLGAVFCLLAFAHPDIVETARHGYILIRSTLDGNFLGFFEDVYDRVYGYGYTNAAHYNILLYLLYALWELPLYLIERIGGFAFTDLTLSLWAKWLSAGFYLGCGLLTGALARRLGCGETGCRWAPFFFWLNPISFFTTLIMGQYDSICLFFLLLALLYYLDGKMIPFSLIMGVGMVFKFFPIFLLLPLVLLAEKRLLRAAGYVLLSLWLYLPTSLLFWGRTGDAGFFNQLMIERLFAQVFPGGVKDASLFLLSLALVCIAARLWQPADRAAQNRGAIYFGLVVFSLLFLFVYWHPQWLILLVPFTLLTGLQLRDKTLFALTEGVFCAGFFVLLAALYPGQLEANLIDGGLIALLCGFSFSAVQGARTTGFYFSLIPYLNELAPILFYGPLFAGLIFKLPVGKATLADRLCGDERRFSPRLACWGVFVVGLGGFWAAPTLFSWLKAMGVL